MGPTDRSGAQRPGAVQREPLDDQVAELDEALEEDAAPGLGRLLVLGRDGRARVHLVT